jgi:acyl carrier protein
MDRRAIESEVLAVMRHHVPKLTSADRWLAMELKADLALESITLVVILVELEERLAVEIGEKVDPAQLHTGQDLLDLVAGLLVE